MDDVELDLRNMLVKILAADPGGRSLGGVVGSQLAGGMDVRLLWVLCVVR
jgi:hypothetical protein